VQPPSLDRLDGILKHVSRSFYLSLKILPQSLRCPIGLAYLFARAADTIADTALISPGERLHYLEQFRSLFQTYDATVLTDIGAALIGPQQIPAERELLAALDQCFAVYYTCHQADQARIGQLLLTLIQGMLLDLTIFPHEYDGRVVALKTRDELDRYTYYVAGCVGEFWTEMHVAHRPSLARWNVDAMKQRGVRFGKGLQLTNILRDLARDLRIGRCYIPREDLAPYRLEPTDLLNPTCIARVRPVLQELLAVTLEHYRAGWTYTLAIPRREVQMRLACAWPLFIGFQTLDLIAKADNLLDPTTTVKISRRVVYRLLFGSGLLIFSNCALNRYAQHLRRPLCL
jgi:farnesyl-diphosphate farnesyltransferase